MGGGGKSSSNSDSQASQRVWPAQGKYLKQLYGMGTTLAGNNSSLTNSVDAGNSYAGQVTGDVYDPVTGSYASTFGTGNYYDTAAKGVTNPLISSLSKIANTDTGQYVTSANKQLLDSNIASTLEQASQNLQRNILPGIASDASAAGQYGGSRQGIASGLALSDANKQALQTASNMYQNQYQNDVAANLQAQQQSDATKLAAAQQMQDILAGNTANTSSGVNTGSSLANLGMSQSDIYNSLSNNQWGNLDNLASIIGGPTVLGSTGSSSSGKGGGVSVGGK